MPQFGWPKRRKLQKALLAGLCGGLAGTIAMTTFQNGWSKVKRSSSQNQHPNENPSQQSGEGMENATMKAAGKLTALAGRQLSFREKAKAGLAVHYGFGTLMGALYGFAAESLPRPTRRHSALNGAIFGATLFVAADEAAVPILGLSSGSAPLSSHVYGLASHLVYGLTAGIVCTVVRRNL